MIFAGAEYNEDAAAKLNEALDWLNTMLEGKAFVAGDNLTVADISMIVVFSNLEVCNEIENNCTVSLYIIID